MAKTPKWVGSKAIKQDPTSPKFFSTGDEEGYRFIYNGPYQALIAAKPDAGAQVTGYAGYFVGDLKIEPLGAGVDGPGTMTFSVTSTVPGGTTNPEDQTVIEIDAGSLEKSIYLHPKLQDLTDPDRAKIKKSIEAGATVPPSLTPVGNNIEQASKLFYLLIKGVESYLVSAPVVRKTTTTTAKPTVGVIGIGTRSTDKPHASAPNGYVWLKTGDRAQQTGSKGKWERVQEWAGADEWDEYIYGP